MDIELASTFVNHILACQREAAYFEAIHAVRASRYDWFVRTRFLVLLDNDLGKPAIQYGRDIKRYRRVARFFQRRVRVNE